MTTAEDIALADRLTRRRARIATVMAILFMTSMATSLRIDDPGSRPAMVQQVAWVVWAAVLVLVLAVGGLARRAAVRGLMNDETTRANRRDAMVTAFWATIFCTFGLYALSLFVPMTSQEAIRLILSVTVAAALLRFGTLERASLGDG